MLEQTLTEVRARVTILEALRIGKSPRLHWREETSARRLAITKKLINLPTRGIVTVYLHEKETRTERARRRCLETLLVEIDRAGVTAALIESRSPSQDRLDLPLLMGARKAHVLPKEVRVSWRSSREEPLLWAADAVVGATTWWLDGYADCFNLLTEQVRVICLE